MALKESVKQIPSKIRNAVTGEALSLDSFRGSTHVPFTEEPDIFGERLKTPHGEMEASKTIYRNLVQINASIELFTDMIMGRELTIETEDSQGEHYFKNYVLPKLKPALREAVENYCITGNGYIEILRNPATGKPVNFIPIPESEKVYIDYDNNFQPTKYILKNKLNNTKTHTIRYFQDRNSKKRIRGDAFNPEDIIHLKNGISRIPVYGRSDIASAYDDYQIYDELQRDLAVISRWKSIAKHILTVKNINGEPLSKDQKEAFEEAISNSDDNENIITNKAIEKTELGYQGRHENIQDHIKQINKRITSSIIPSFYLHGDVTNYAVAEDQKSALYLRVQSKRDSFKHQIDKVLREIAEKEGYQKDVTLKFGEFDFPTKKEKIENRIKGFQVGGVKLNELRDILNLEPDEELGDAYKPELTPQEQQQLEKELDLEKLLKKINR